MKFNCIDKSFVITVTIAGLSLAILEAYVWRDLANLWDTDLISYLDNGERFWNGDFNQFINLYWSPLYGILVALILKLSGSTFENELAIVRQTNMAIYGFLILCFLSYLRTLKSFLKNRFSMEESQCQERYWGVCLVTLTAIFFYSTLTLGQTMYGTPDLLSTCFAFIVSTFALGLADKLERKEKLPIKEGLALALAGLFAYLSKAPLFPYAIATLAGLLIAARKVKQARSVILISLGALFILYSPYLILISNKAGHFTFSDVFKVGQSWNIFAKQPITHGRSPSFLHPTRIFSKRPEAYEFDDNLAVTYSPWYAPCYWYEGVGILIDWQAYVGRVLVNILRYLAFFLFGAGLFWLAGLKDRLALSSPSSTAFLWLPAAAGLGFMLIGMDMSVNTDRYYSPYLVPLFTTFFISLSKLPTGKSYKNLRTLSFLISSFCILRLAIFFHSYSLIFDTANRPEGFRAVEIPAADLLKKMGLKPGDKIAQIGSCRYYFARLAKLKIIVDFTKPKEFWQLSEEEQSRITARLKKLGVKALIQEPYLKEVPLSLREQDLPKPNDHRLTNWLTLVQDEKGWSLMPAYQPDKESWDFPSTFMVLNLER
ncbi:MAG: hypothetical protein LCH63_20245 [Candidatus Melainabacteria bacterium]|nr:hypothetical protein [Candidatus Melainabacteria bacterium]